MEPARCPSCNAAVAGRAAWCTLCFADLRPVEQRTTPVPVPPPAEPAVAAVPAAATPAAPAATPSAPAAPPATALAAPAAPAAVSTAPAAPTPGAAGGWPCLTCGAQVSFELDSCPQCGASFLAGTDVKPVLAVPVVGDLARANAGMRLVVGLVAGAVICGVFLLLLLILGKVF